MTNTTAFVLGFILLSLGLADYLFNDAGNLVFLGRKGLGVVEYLAFWR